MFVAKSDRLFNVCLFICLSTKRLLSVYLPVSLLFIEYLSTNVLVSFYAFISVSKSFWCLSIYLSVHLNVWLFLRLTVWLSVSPTVCQSDCLSIWYWFHFQICSNLNLSFKHFCWHLPWDGERWKVEEFCADWPTAHLVILEKDISDIESTVNLVKYKVQLSHKVSISPTFYEQLFRTKVFRAALFVLLRFVLFWRKKIARHKMLLKLTEGF